MRKINYRITVNITQKTMKLGFRAKMPEEMEGKRIRVQAVFTQRQVERRFPMEVVIEEGEVGEQIRADAEILLPYVFYSPPRHKVNVVFALWCGAEEISLDDQPFPVQKELFARAEIVRKRNLLKFAGCSLGLPFLLVRDYFKEGKNFIKAAKRANETVYRISGYNYSARQQNTDYFAARYRKYVAKNKVKPNQILFLSEREPEEGGNLMLVKKWFEENEPEVEITTFINTKTVDQLKKRELRECALKCATSAVIILEDFYPQLHSIHKRNETKIIQLWHACGAFKTFGLTRMGKKGGAPQTSMNHRNYDLVPVSSDTVRDIYAEAFGISPSKVQALGVPRTG
ncbi:MAG: CDP-glycerol glycerophosphotransferase family protein [Anaerobutyricum soehngenii]